MLVSRKETKSMSKKFKVGDRVKGANTQLCRGYGVAGLQGTIIYDDGDSSVNLLVEYDEHRLHMHTGSGKCPSGRGLWMDKEDLEYIGKSSESKDVSVERKFKVGVFWVL